MPGCYSSVVRLKMYPLWCESEMENLCFCKMYFVHPERRGTCVTKFSFGPEVNWKWNCRKLFVLPPSRNLQEIPTHLFPVPTAPPTKLSVQLNETLLVIQWGAPSPDRVNGILRGYDIVVTQGQQVNKVRPGSISSVVHLGSSNVTQRYSCFYPIP